MWTNIGEPERTQMTIWRMRIACWITKATNTHSEYVIFIAFPVQQWLYERTVRLPDSTLPVLYKFARGPVRGCDFVRCVPFCNFMFPFAYIFIWVRKLDSDSLTETKNWSCRNEVIETSGRLHPSWPQNKRLRTPWTADWMRTGLDRQIQTELAFTLAKNATKPNPFEIVSLQTTWKENNWKIEETLARTVVTLETERIKGSSPWCLWWWWWWSFPLLIGDPEVRFFWRGTAISRSGADSK